MGASWRVRSGSVRACPRERDTAVMDADRVLDDLRELARLTGGPDGARRVCWTDEWARARELLRSRLDELPVEVSVDAAGNLWAEASRGKARASSSSARTWTRCRPAAGSTAPSGSSPRSKLCARMPAGTRPRSGCGWSTGPTRRARASGAASSAPRPVRARSRSTTSAIARPRRGAPRGRGRPLRRGPGPGVRVRRAPARSVRVPRAAHRAGAGPGGPRRAGRNGAGDLRRRALRGGVHRPGSSCRRHPDVTPARLLRRDCPGRACDPRDRAATRGGRLHGRRRHQRARGDHRGRGPDRDAARPAPPRPG